ncbi:hypothetical protein MRX96_044639 [Rhipicephalus microplus]
MDEIAPPPKYRLNLRVVLMSLLIWMGTFLVFAAISVTLAITTNALYFLFIIMGLVVSTFAMAFYKPEGPWEPMMPYSRLCEPRLETHAPVFVEEKSAVYPPSPSVKSVTHSDPWLCTSAKTTLRGSFSTPRLRTQGGRHVACGCGTTAQPDGSPSLGIPSSGTRRRGPQSVDDHARQPQPVRTGDDGELSPAVRLLREPRAPNNIRRVPQSQ